MVDVSGPQGSPFQINNERSDERSTSSNVRLLPGGSSAAFDAFTPPPSTGRVPRRLRRKKRPIYETGLKILSVAGGVMLFNGATQLIETDTAGGKMKAAIIAGSGAVTQSTIVMSALERAAPAAVLGYRGAALMGGASIAAVGAAMATASITGMAMPDVDRQRLEEHGRQMSAFTGQLRRTTEKSGEVEAVVSSLGKGAIENLLDCERRGSCPWGGPPGEGRVARAILPLLGEARLIATQLKAGVAGYAQASAAIDKELQAYRMRVRKGGDVAQLRSDLEKIDLRWQAAVGRLEAAHGVAAARAFVKKLEAGVDLKDRPAAADGINAALRTAADAIKGALDGAERGEAAAVPEFPGRTGIPQVLAHIFEMLPIAAVVFLIDIALPLLAFVFRIFELRGQRPVDDEDDPDASNPFREFEPRREP